jgi:copper chaperone CopZ
MKKVWLMTAIVFVVASSHAQFTKATLQATGLTCAMCSNAINKALQKVSFIESVRSDIKNSAFNIVFKEGEDIKIDELRKAVEDAGFSVGSLKLTGNFHELKIDNDTHVEIGKEVFHFLNVNEQVLNGEQTISVVDKNFVTAKQFRKFSSASKMSCVATGKAGSCCAKEGIAPDARIYHVTI